MRRLVLLRALLPTGLIAQHFGYDFACSIASTIRMCRPAGADIWEVDIDLRREVTIPGSAALRFAEQMGRVDRP